MKAKIYSLSILLACCVTAMAIAPQKSTMKQIPTNNGKKIETVQVQKAAKAATELAEGVIYEEDFEDPENSWTLIQTPGESESALGIEISTSASAYQGFVPGVSGEYYLSGNYDSYVDVNQWAISGGVQIKAGTYFVSAFVRAEDSYGDDQFRITMGSSNAPAAQTTVLFDNSGDKFQAYTSWTLISNEFTVEEDGIYYFGWNHIAPKDAFVAAMDWFRITTFKPELPKPSFKGITNLGTWEGAWSSTPDPYTVYLNSDSAQVGIQVSVTLDDECDWLVTGSAKAATKTKDAVLIGLVWENSGDATVTFKASNEAGEVGDTYNFRGYVNADKDVSDVLTNIAPINQINAIGYGLKTIGTMNYAEGFSHLGENEKAHIESVQFAVYGAYFEDMADSLITIRVLGATVGFDIHDKLMLLPDDEQVLGSKTMTLKEFLGNEDAYIENPTVISVVFDKPVNVQGDYFVAYELPALGEANADNNYIDFFYFDLGNGKLINTTDNFFARGTIYFDIAKSGWDSEMNYYEDLVYQVYKEYGYTYVGSLGIYPQVTFGEYVDEAVKNVDVEASKLAIYPMPARDVLYVNNLAADASVTITDLTGRTVATYNAASVSNGINVKALSQGVYVLSVKDANGTAASKFVKE